MIKVGEVYQDKTTNKHYEVLNFFAGQIKISDGKNQYYISEEHFNLIFESPDYKKMYQQQKQRADRAEKRWSELKERLIEKCKSDRTVAKQYSRAFLCLLDELEGKENVFETVQQLEEDDE